ncbi:hypothetical protein [Methylobacterium sp. AMS5]|uniref:hypothetical protein n=1 Tax=Methylobacterium sp. AMS5 TaxID=925818 RepID=UPI00074F999B|nr:hypothetical protein [Methylobacterium sp. AMS5]AMB48360.1 hypothetical protein Y590_25665 [Methylobacterium sp. AMS5]
MPDYYRVTFKTKQFVSIVEGKGKKQTTRQVENFIEQSHGGLPMSTCLAYKKLAPDAVIERDYDYAGYDSKARTRVTSGSERKGSAQRRDPFPGSKKPIKDDAAPSPAPAGVIGGDYADLVNKMVAKGAAA